MSNVSLDKLNVAVPSRDRIASPLDLIDIQIDAPTFGDHLQRATTPPEDPGRRRPVQNSSISDRTPAEAEATDATHTPDERAEINDGREENTNNEQHEPTADSGTPSEDIADHHDGDPPADEVESEQTSSGATNGAGQDDEPEEGSPNTAVTQQIVEELSGDEVSEEEVDEEAGPRRTSDGSAKPLAKQLPQPTTSGEAGSLEGANANTKPVAADQLLVDPSDAEALEDDGESSTSANGSAEDDVKKRPTGDTVPTDPNLKDHGVTTAASSNATKTAEGAQGAASLQGGDADGKRESEPKEGRHSRRAKQTQSSQTNTPATAPTEKATAGPTSLEKSPAAAEVEQIVARATAKDTPADSTPVKISGQPSSTPSGEALVAPAGDHRVSSSLDQLEATQTLRDSRTSGADRARFVQRVAKAFQVAGEREGQITLRLNPPELGSVRLNITIRDGVLRAHLETETTSARQALLENLPALRERLAEQDVKIEQFDVELRDEQRDGADGKRTGDRENRNNSPGNEEQPKQTSILNSEQESASEPTGVTKDGGLNVVI